MYPYTLLPSIFRDVLANLHLLSFLKRRLSSEVTERPNKHESVVLREPSQVADFAASDLIAA